MASGEEYDPNGFHAFLNIYTSLHPDMSSDLQCVVAEEHPYNTDRVKWDSIDCDQPMAFVCQIPLGELAYWIVIYQRPNHKLQSA